jgi:hypothetical protein
MKYSNHQTKYIGKQVGLRAYQHPDTLLTFTLQTTRQHFSEHRYDILEGGKIGEGEFFVCQPYLHGNLGR